jgi:hypothetical protein
MTQRLIEPTTVQVGPRPSVRHLVARHPVAAFLCISYAVTWATAVPWFRERTDILPFDLPMWGSLGTIFGVALAAVLVVAASDGRAGVRDLARRSLRWRVGVRWYLLAVLGLPVVVLAGAIALFGTAALEALADDWRLLFTRVLPVLAAAHLCARVVLLWLYNATGAFLLAAVGLVMATRGRLAYEKKGP